MQSRAKKVVIESLSSRIFGAAFIVYIVPMLVFVIGYIIAASCGLSEGMSVLCSFIAFCVAVAVIVVYQRRSKRKNPIKFEIVKLR